jgi:hypothetical protein
MNYSSNMVIFLVRLLDIVHVLYKQLIVSAVCPSINLNQPSASGAQSFARTNQSEKWFAFWSVFLVAGDAVSETMQP